MNFDFEEHLRRQSIRPVPPEWREEILRTAQGARDAAPQRNLFSVPQTSKSAVPQVSKPAGRRQTWKSAAQQVWKPALRIIGEWLWPHPRAWAGLAAAWGIILLLHVAAPEDPAAAGQAASASWQEVAFLRQETAIIAQLSDSDENRPAPPANPAALKPRSSRRVKPSIG